MNEQYQLRSPSGEQLIVTKELFLAMQSFINSEARPSGSVQIEFRSGAISSVASFTKKVYK